MLRQEELAEKEKALTAVEEELTQKSEMLAAADKQLSQKENRVEKLTDREKEIQGRIKSIEDSGQMLTLKQLENIETKVHAPLVGKTGVILSVEDEKTLRKMAMETAKANEEVQKYKRIARAAIETIRDIIQAIGLLKFNFKGNAQPVNNLTPEQDILITAIRKHGIDISRSHGYNKLADEMKKAALVKPLSEIFHGLEKEYHDKNKLSFLDEARQIARTQNAQNHNAPCVNRGRKGRGEVL